MRLQEYESLIESKNVSNKWHNCARGTYDFFPDLIPYFRSQMCVFENSTLFLPEVSFEVVPDPSI